MVLGVITEWSTLVFDALEDRDRFIVLVLVLVVRPQGIFGKAKAL